MWHELHAPSGPGDVAWSTPKLNEIRNSVERVRADVEAKRQNSARTAAGIAGGQLMVMHGPSGCGKLSTIRALFPEDNGFAVKAFHAVEHDIEALANFLQEALLVMTTPRAPAARQVERPPAAIDLDGIVDVDADEDDLGDDPFSGGPSPPKEASVEFWVVKELPHTWNSNRPALDNVLNGFFSSFTRARYAAQRGSGNASARPPPIVFVIFTHTIHDTHSEKVDLGNTFPSAFLASPEVNVFKCTAITERNLTNRLMAIVKLRGLANTIPKVLVEDVASRSNGDIRHALLQLQWACLIPPRKGRAAPKKDTKSATKTTKASKGGGASGKPKSVLDLCDDLFDSQPKPSAGPSSDNTAKCSPVPPSTAHPRFRGFAAGQAHEDSELVGDRGADNNDDDEELPAKRFRDEHIDVSHAAARLLLQRYTVADVMRVSSAPSWKLMGYMWNSLPHYFGEDTAAVTAYAATSDAASDSDRWIPFGEGGRNLAIPDRAGDVAFDRFNVAYRMAHEDPVVPRTFLSLRPMRHQPDFFPVVSSVHRRWQPYSAGADKLSHEDADDETFSAAAASIQRRDGFGRWASGVISAGNANAEQLRAAGHVREAILPAGNTVVGSTGVFTDVLPFMSRVLLDSGNQAAGPSNPTATAVPVVSSAPTPPPAAAQGGRTRTLFRPRSAVTTGSTPAPQASAPPKKDRVSNLAVAVSKGYAAQWTAIKKGQSSAPTSSGGRFGNRKTNAPPAALPPGAVALPMGISASPGGASEFRLRDERFVMDGQLGNGSNPQQGPSSAGGITLPSAADDDPIEDFD